MPAAGDGWTPSREVDGSSGGPRTVNSELKKLVTLRVYKRRWFVLLLLCLLNCSNATIWLTFAPVADQSAQFLGVTSEQINWLSLVFMVVAIPVSFGTTWMLETLGLRFTLILGAWLNMFGGFVRFIGAVWPSFPVVMSGQTVGALAQPLIVFTPTKLAAHWFPDHQRATANMIASMSNPLGILLANVVSPLVAGRPQQIPTLLLVYAVPTGLICFLTTLGFRSSAPPTPPSVSAELSCSEPFLPGLKRLLKNRSYLVLLVAIGSGLAVFTCVSSLLEQILCVHGYTDDFAGLCGALLIVFGVVGAGLLGFYVDRTKNFTEATKINMSFTALSGIAFSVVSLLPQQKVAIAATCSLFGFFGFSIYPVAMELAVECSYPVGEATSTGLIFICGQILSVLYMILLQGLTKPIASSPLSTCGGAVLSWKVPLLVMSGLCSFFTCFFVIFFHTRYRRLDAEEDATYRAAHAAAPTTSE
ncbi:solute carrier family 49 member A3 [Neosynchiropus ocellatus]